MNSRIFDLMRITATHWKRARRLLALASIVLLASPVAAQSHLLTGKQPTGKPQSNAAVKPASHGEIITTHGPQVASDCGCSSCSGGSCGTGSCGNSCGIGLCCGTGTCGTPNYWVRAEGLAWWLDGFETPALVTTSTAGTARDNAGVLGQGGTSTLFGGTIGDEAAGGGRIAIGTWINPCRDIGLEFSYFQVESDGTDFIADSSTASIIARPFFNVSTGQQDAELVVFPNVVTGSIRIHSDTEFSGGELLIQRSLGGSSQGRLTGVFGYRFQHLEDSLQFNEAITSIDTASPIEPGTTFNLRDNFRTENEFHGAEIGILAELCSCNRVTMELMAKFAFGNTHSRAAVNGTTRIVTPSGSDTTNAGGLLALPSNSGTFEADDFTIVPEIALRMNYDLGCNWQLQFGYTFIYWSNVARPGDQIDTRLNLTQLPPGPQTGDNLPAFRLVTDDFWAQGLNLGLQYDF